MLSLHRHSPQHSALLQHTACISFAPTGEIKEASPLFLNTVGYTLEQVKGQHHRMFCFSEETNQPEYAAFWETLAAGYSQQGRFRRLNAEGREIWLEATYIPIKNRRGKVIQIFKVASDVTEKHQQSTSQVLPVTVFNETCSNRCAIDARSFLSHPCVKASDMPSQRPLCYS